MKVTNNFSIEEFVPRSLHKRWGDVRSCWFIDDRLPHLAQFIRDRFKKPILINTWPFTDIGGMEFRGYRPTNCKVGVSKSQHRYGRAIDIEMDNLEEVYEDIINNKKIYYKAGLRGLEDFNKTKVWIHLDMRYTQNEDIFIF